MIAAYQLETRLNRVPPELRDVLECVMQSTAVDRWLQNTESFSDEGKTPLDLLTQAADRNDEAELRDNVRRVVGPFYKAIGYASAPGVLPIEKLLDVVVQEMIQTKEPASSGSSSRQEEQQQMGTQFS